MCAGSKFGRLGLALWLLSACVALQAQNKSYRVRGEVVVFEVETNEVLVTPEVGLEWQALQDSVTYQADVANVSAKAWQDKIKGMPSSFKGFQKKGSFAPRLPGVSDQALAGIARKSRAISSITPVLKFRGRTVIPTGTIAVRFIDPKLTNAIQLLESTLHVRNVPEKIQQEVNHFQLINSEDDPFSVAQRAAEHPNVAWAEPDISVGRMTLGTPNDPLFTNQFLFASGQGVNLPTNWHTATNGNKVVVAIIDDGVEIDHPDLAGKILPGYDLVDGDNDPTPDSPDGHGTACAGVIAAVTDNGLGVAGLAAGCQILPIRVDRGSYWRLDNIARGFALARQSGAKIINYSAGGPPSSQLYLEIDKAVEEGKLIVAAAGNTGGNLEFPASYEKTVAVGALTKLNKRQPYSCFGFGAVGGLVVPSGDIGWKGDIWTTDLIGSRGNNPGGATRDEPSGDYVGRFGGTSAAAAVTSGVAALVWSAYPSLSAAQVRTVLCQSASKVDPSGGLWKRGLSRIYGNGKLDATAALRLASTTAANTNVSAVASAAHPISYSVRGSHILLEPETNLVSIIIDSNASPAAATIARDALFAKEATNVLPVFPQQPKILLMAPKLKGLTSKAVTLFKESGVPSVPVFRADGNLAIPTGTFFAELNSGKTPADVSEIFGGDAVTVRERGDNRVEIKLNANADFTNVWEKLNSDQGTNILQWAEPDLIIKSAPR